MVDTAWVIKQAMNEARLLILGAQVLVGFHFRVVLEPGFEGLGAAGRWVMLGSLALLLVVCGLLIAGPAHHQVVAGGEPTRREATVTARLVTTALGPMAVATALDYGLAAWRVGGVAVGGACAGAALAVMLGTWYLWPGFMRRRRAGVTMDAQHGGGERDVQTKVEHVLTEARVVIPGVQALLGFGTIAVLSGGFDDLPRTLKGVHLASLSAIVVSLTLVMAPAAYHRVVERGGASERFHRVASRLLLAGMATLGVGLSLGFWLVVERSTESRAAGVAGGAALLVLLEGLWFGWTTWVRASQRSRGGAHALG